MPTLTILIPAYNAEAYVAEAIDSALRQTFGDLDVLVVDDGSKDRTAERAQSLNGLVRLLKVPHGGVSSARNHGLRSARGHFVLFLDADDLLEETTASRAIDFLTRRPELAFVFCNTRLILPDGRLTPGRIPLAAFGTGEEVILDSPIAQVLDRGYSISSSGLCARREALDEAGLFDETLWGVEDFEYWSRMYVRRPIGYLTSPSVRLRRHSDNMTNQLDHMLPCMVVALQKVEGHCRSSGRIDMLAPARRYTARCMNQMLRGLVILGRQPEARALLWQYRRLLRGPAWLFLLLVASLPSSLVAGFVRVARGFKGRARVFMHDRGARA